MLASFFAYYPAFTGGVRVAVGNVDGSDRASLITAPGPGGGPHVRSIKLLTSRETVVATMETASFFAYHPTFTGGVFVAAGNVTSNGLAEIITGPDTGGGPHIQTFSAGGLPLGGGLLRLPLRLHRRRPRGLRQPGRGRHRRDRDGAWGDRRPPHLGFHRRRRAKRHELLRVLRPGDRPGRPALHGELTRAATGRPGAIAHSRRCSVGAALTVVRLPSRYRGRRHALSCRCSREATS